MLDRTDGYVSRMSKFAIRRPVMALIVWFAAVIGLGVFAGSLQSTFNDSFSLPGAQSTQAQDLLEKLDSGKTSPTTIKVIWAPMSGDIDSSETRKAVEPVLKESSGLSFVSCVQDPYGQNFGSQ